MESIINRKIQIKSERRWNERKDETAKANTYSKRIRIESEVGNDAPKTLTT